MEIILVRHAQSVGNIQNLYSGITDDELSDFGKKQANQLAKHLAETLVNVEKIYSSPLKRAVDTATVISKYLLMKDFEIDERLSEVNMGIWEGLSEEVIKLNYSEIFRNWQDNPYESEIPQSEKFDSVITRIYDFCQEKANSDYKRIVVVTHSGVIHMLLIKLLGRDWSDFWSIKVDNASYSVIEWSKLPQVVSINQTPYLT